MDLYKTTATLVLAAALEQILIIRDRILRR